MFQNDFFGQQQSIPPPAFQFPPAGMSLLPHAAVRPAIGLHLGLLLLLGPADRHASSFSSNSFFNNPAHNIWTTPSPAPSFFPFNNQAPQSAPTGFPPPFTPQSAPPAQFAFPPPPTKAPKLEFETLSQNTLDQCLVLVCDPKAVHREAEGYLLHTFFTNWLYNNCRILPSDVKRTQPERRGRYIVCFVAFRQPASREAVLRSTPKNRSQNGGSLTCGRPEEVIKETLDSVVEQYVHPLHAANSNGSMAAATSNTSPSTSLPYRGLPPSLWP
ncbi:hypothetical protein M3Y99_00551100 [Aphelenchoides fujianensis]|nr:hypothetical protein M3Y99_00551100 [Aphelenchoides fujianensis]